MLLVEELILFIGVVPLLLLLVLLLLIASEARLSSLQWPKFLLSIYTYTGTGVYM